MPIPRASQHLPDLMAFSRDLSRAYQAGLLTSWRDLGERARDFYTPRRMATIERTLPGWQTMAAGRNGQTVVHITAAMIVLLSHPVYQRATPDERAMLEWMVLFHDLAKDLSRFERDTVHAFRSAAIAGRQLPELGFPVYGDDASLEAWLRLTWNAVIINGQQAVQDNRQLPAITDGIARLFGRNTPSALIIKAVLFHLSIDVVMAYPQAAPLTLHEIKQYITPPLLPVLRAMMLVDSIAWCLFDPITRRRQTGETEAVFEHITQLIRTTDDRETFNPYYPPD